MRSIEEVLQRSSGDIDINWPGTGQLVGLKENLEAEANYITDVNLKVVLPQPQIHDLANQIVEWTGEIVRFGDQSAMPNAFVHAPNC